MIHIDEAKLNLLTDKQRLEVEKLIEENLCMTFVPTGKGEEFINMISSGKYLVNVFSAANDCQKTTTLINIIINLIYEEPMSQWFDKPFFKNFKRPCKVRLCSDPATIEGKLVPDLRKWLPKGTYKAYKGQKSYERLWEFNNGSTMDIFSYEQDVKEFESVDRDVILFSEPPDKELFDASIARMREKVFVVIEMTPLSKADWMVDKLDDPNWGIVYADSESNCLTHGKRGIRTHEAIQEKISQYDPDEIDARSQGKFMCLSGVIYKIFNKDVHVIKPHEIRKDYVLGMTIDPHAAKPFAILWWALTSTGDLIFIDEFPEENFEKLKRVNWTVEDYVHFIKDTESEFPNPVEYRYIDPNYGKSPDVITSRTLIDEFMDYDMFFDANINDDLDEGILAVKGRLRYDKTKPVSGSNKPTVYFFDTLNNTIRHITKWGYREWKQQKGKSLSERAEDKYKDFNDCVRYTIIKDPLYKMPKMVSYKHVGRRYEYSFVK